MSYYVFTWNETDRTLKIACLCSEIFSVCACVCERNDLWLQWSPSRPQNNFPGQQVLFAVCFDRDWSEGPGALFRKLPADTFLCTTAAIWGATVHVCVCKCVWVCVRPSLVSDWPWILSRQINCQIPHVIWVLLFKKSRKGQENVGNKCKKALWRKEAIFKFFFPTNFLDDLTPSHWVMNVYV